MQTHQSSQRNDGKAWRRTISFRQGVACLCFLTAVGSLVALGVASLVSPRADLSDTPWGWSFWLSFMVRTFAFHIAAAAMVAGVVGVWAAGRQKRGGRWWPLVCAVACVAIAWPDARLVVPRSSGAAVGGMNPSDRVAGGTLRVLSMNLLFTNRNYESVRREIQRVDADVVMLQEHHMDWDRVLRPLMRSMYPYECVPLKEGIFGQAVYSKVPFVGAPMLKRLQPKDYCPQIGVVLDVGGHEVELWNVHLMSPSGVDSIERQWRQVQVLRQMLEQRTRPMVLAGDFNSTLTCWNASVLRSLGCREAHATVGGGRGATWPDLTPARYLPGVRIDQLWGSEGVEWLSSSVGESVGSDHLPNIVEFRAAGAK